MRESRCPRANLTRGAGGAQNLVPKNRRGDGPVALLCHYEESAYVDGCSAQPYIILGQNRILVLVLSRGRCRGGAVHRRGRRGIKQRLMSIGVAALNQTTWVTRTSSPSISVIFTATVASPFGASSSYLPFTRSLFFSGTSESAILNTSPL